MRRSAKVATGASDSRTRIMPTIARDNSAAGHRRTSPIPGATADNIARNSPRTMLTATTSAIPSIAHMTVRPISRNSSAPRRR